MMGGNPSLGGNAGGLVGTTPNLAGYNPYGNPLMNPVIR